MATIKIGTTIKIVVTNEAVKEKENSIGAAVACRK